MANIFADVFGSTPDVAPFIPTDPLKELQTLLSGEAMQWPEIENISNLYQQYMLGALNEAVPGFTDILKEGGLDTQTLLKEALPLEQGQIPADVASQILRSTAFQSLQSGTAGSPMSSALTARDLGLTSLDLMNQGANMLGAGTNAAQRWAGIASGTILPPTQNMYSPAWFSQFMQQQNAAKQATQQLQNNLNAAPNPIAAGVSGTLMNLLGAYLGHGMGGGGGSITPSYSSVMGGSGASSPGGGIGGYGVGGVGGFGYGGVNPYAATTGGFNFGGSNFGGSNIPYFGGDVGAPPTLGYGQQFTSPTDFGYWSGN